MDEELLEVSPAIGTQPTEAQSSQTVLEQKTCIWSILSIVCAFLFSPLGIVFGIVALVRIKRNPTLKGKGLAIAGIAIGVVLPLLFLLLMVLFGIILGFSSNSAIEDTSSSQPSNGDLFSDTICENVGDCPDDMICFGGYCADASQELVDYVEENYATEDCADIPCDNCTLERLHTTGIGRNNFRLSFCGECSIGSRIFGRNEGYTCELYYCVPE